MTGVFLRSETLEAVGSSLAAGGYEMVKGDEFRTKFNDVVMVILAQKEIQDKLKSSLLYKPLANFVTLGIYNMFAGNNEESVSSDLSKSSPSLSHL